MIHELFYVEKSAYRKSLIHAIDARVKLIVTFAMIIITVAIPYSTVIFRIGGLFMMFIAVLWVLSTLSPFIFLKRVGTILPFGLFIILFQIFLTNPYYSSFHVIVHLPLGIHIYSESVEFASILFLKFLVCIAAIVVLSSTTKLQEMLDGARQLGLPSDLVLALGMMIRYLFVFGYIFRKIHETFQTKCFDPLDNRLPYKFRLQQIGYTIGTLFLRSYEQGERTYVAMLCRGYNRHSQILIRKKGLSLSEWTFLIVSLSFLVLVPLFSFLLLHPS